MSLLALLLFVPVRAGTAIRVTPAGFVGKEPQVAASGARVFVACGNGDALFVLRSTDGGSSFSQPVALPTAGKLALGMRRGPRIALAGKTVVVSAIYGAKGGGADGELVSWRSTDDGQTWKGPSRVSDVPGAAREGLHAMTASSTGRLACAWLDLRGKGTEVWLSTSDDGGANWSKNALVYRSPSGTVCECCHPSVAFGKDGRVHVMFRNWLGGSRDMYLATSGDGGKTFDAAEKLGAGTWPLNACPMDGGALAVRADGAVETVWRRGNKVFLCAPRKIERELGDGTQPWIASDGRTSRAVWLNAEGKVRATDGRTFSGGQDPVVASVAGRGLAFWADRSGRVWAQPLP